MERDPLRWQTHLGRWVTDITVPRVVEELRTSGYPLTDSAVYKWISGERTPRPEVAIRLVELSGGQLSFSDIYVQRFEVHTLQLRGSSPERRVERMHA